MYLDPVGKVLVKDGMFYNLPGPPLFLRCACGLSFLIDNPQFWSYHPGGTEDFFYPPEEGQEHQLVYVRDTFGVVHKEEDFFSKFSKTKVTFMTPMTSYPELTEAKLVKLAKDIDKLNEYAAKKLYELPSLVPIAAPISEKQEKYSQIIDKIKEGSTELETLKQTIIDIGLSILESDPITWEYNYKAYIIERRPLKFSKALELIVSFNDNEGTHFSDVKEIIKRTIKRLKEELNEE